MRVDSTGTPPSRQGFTLVEVLVALGVLAIGILGVISVFIFGISSTEHGKKLSKATTYGRDILEIIRSRGLAYSDWTGDGVMDIPPPASSGLNDSPSDRVPLNAAPPNGAFNDKLPDDPGFYRNISITDASTSASDHLARQNIQRITVTIYWKEEGTERSTSMTALLRPTSSGAMAGAP